MAKPLDEIQIDRLYDLLRRAERERDTESAAALRWAIFTLEMEAKNEKISP